MDTIGPKKICLEANFVGLYFIYWDNSQKVVQDHTDALNKENIGPNLLCTVI